MMSYTQFTLNERKYLQELLSKGYSFRKIADFLGRNVSSVSREVNRNKSKYPPKKKSNNKFRYHAWRAQTLSVIRRRENQKYCLAQGSDEWEYIVEKLSLYWSPEEISARWKLEHPDSKGFSTSTIYRYIKKKRFEGISRKTHLRRRGKLIMPRSSCYNSVHPERIIPEWPEEIKQRSRIGDWEGDTVYGAVGKGLIVTLVDRKSRYLCGYMLTIIRLVRHYPLLLGAHYNLNDVAISENLLCQSLNIGCRYAVYCGEILLDSVDAILIVVVNSC